MDSIYDLGETGICRYCGRHDALRMVEGERVCIRCELEGDHEADLSSMFPRTWSANPSRQVVNLDLDVPTGRALVWPIILFWGILCGVACYFGHALVEAFLR